LNLKGDNCIVFYTLPTSIPSFTVAIDLPSDLQQS